MVYIEIQIYCERIVIAGISMVATTLNFIQITYYEKNPHKHTENSQNWNSKIFTFFYCLYFFKVEIIVILAYLK